MTRSRQINDRRSLQHFGDRVRPGGMDKKPSMLKRIWTVIVKAIRENGDVNERRNMMQAKRGSYGPAQRF